MSSERSSSVPPPRRVEGLSLPTVLGIFGVLIVTVVTLLFLILKDVSFERSESAVETVADSEPVAHEATAIYPLEVIRSELIALTARPDSGEGEDARKYASQEFGRALLSQGELELLKHLDITEGSELSTEQQHALRKIVRLNYYGRILGKTAAVNALIGTVHPTLGRVLSGQG